MTKRIKKIKLPDVLFLWNYDEYGDIMITEKEKNILINAWCWKKEDEKVALKFWESLQYEAQDNKKTWALFVRRSERVA